MASGRCFARCACRSVVKRVQMWPQSGCARLQSLRAARTTTGRPRWSCATAAPGPGAGCSVVCWPVGVLVRELTCRPRRIGQDVASVRRAAHDGAVQHADEQVGALRARAASGAMY